MGAIEKIAAWIEGRAREANIEIWEGDDWWQLSPHESAVFRLRLEDKPRLVAVWEVYTAVKGMTHNDFWGTELCDEARREFGLEADRMADAGDFRRMAGNFGLSIRQATGIFYKMERWTVRHMKFDDEKE
jgi:hypothetical protein